jgi:hypothetical protein
MQAHTQFIRKGDHLSTVSRYVVVDNDLSEKGEPAIMVEDLSLPLGDNHVMISGFDQLKTLINGSFAQGDPVPTSRTSLLQMLKESAPFSVTVEFNKILKPEELKTTCAALRELSDEDFAAVSLAGLERKFLGESVTKTGYYCGTDAHGYILFIDLDVYRVEGKEGPATRKINPRGLNGLIHRGIHYQVK